jgi:hypothetical protein
MYEMKKYSKKLHGLKLFTCSQNIMRRKGLKAVEVFVLHDKTPQKFKSLLLQEKC